MEKNTEGEVLKADAYREALRLYAYCKTLPKENAIESLNEVLNGFDLSEKEAIVQALTDINEHLN